jgi:uncharacterized protein YdbL (DUF1318 family)
MRKLMLTLLGATALLAGCVTINVYFPAAAAQKAADKIISKVIGPDEQTQGENPRQQNQPPANGSSSGEDNGTPLAARFLDALIPAANAAEPQQNLDIQTPEIQATEARMRQRYESTLKALLNAGAIGFTHDGLVAVRDASKAPLAQRAQMNSAVADENRDRKALYKQIAQANGHPEWAGEFQSSFAKRWINLAHSGWYYQDASGKWVKK